MECQSGLGRDGERENRRLRRDPARLRENEQRRHGGVPCSRHLLRGINRSLQGPRDQGQMPGWSFARRPQQWHRHLRGS